MVESIIGMRDMGVIFEVTDAMGISRESISVPLGKEDPGAVRKLPTGDIEIVIPESIPLEDWLATLQEELEKLGYELEQE
ncbi:MAG: hypothetical protein QGI09_01055 [Dehalococcoidia bacterium]|jgi:hypothetical protein|nr:hypothetical protein [Dehalococcoidia bacterium]